MQATRENSYVELGLSPRGTIALVRMAKAWAFIRERNYVTPGDVYQVFKDVGKHRLVLNTKARVSHVTEEAILTDILTKVKQAGYRYLITTDGNLNPISMIEDVNRMHIIAIKHEI